MKDIEFFTSTFNLIKILLFFFIPLLAIFNQNSFSIIKYISLLPKHKVKTRSSLIIGLVSRQLTFQAAKEGRELIFSAAGKTAASTPSPETKRRPVWGDNYPRRWMMNRSKYFVEHDRGTGVVNSFLDTEASGR